MRKTANKSLQLLPITETGVVGSIWVLRDHTFCVESVSSFGTGRNVATVESLQSGNVATVAMLPAE